LNISEEFTKIKDELQLLNSSLQSKDRSPFVDLILSESGCTTTEKLESEVIISEDFGNLLQSEDERNVSFSHMKFTKQIDFKGKKLTSFSPVIKGAALIKTKPPLTPGVKLYSI